MTNMMFGLMGNTGIPADEKVVRSTALPVQKDAPPAMESDTPQWNEPAETDQNPNLGMNTRTVASHWVEGEQSAPFWRATVDAQTQHNFLVDKQVSTSGTAAAREASGEFGHGTMSYAIGIEPQGDLREGGKMGNEYFAAEQDGIQYGAGNYMEPPTNYDQATTAMVDQTGKTEARKAGAGIYDAWWRNGQ